jgi:hypothetical protein
MGPRLVSRGESDMRAVTAAARSWLQWGRGWSAAESGLTDEEMQRRLGMLQWGRG